LPTMGSNGSDEVGKDFVSCHAQKQDSEFPFLVLIDSPANALLFGGFSQSLVSVLPW
jgi:hypothetical protein